MKRWPAAEVSPAAAEVSPAAEVSSAAGASPSTSTSSATSVLTASLRLRDQGRAGKQREPIEFSFHDFDFPLFLCF